MLQWLLMSWVCITTGIMVVLIILTLPSKSAIASAPSISVAKLRCDFGIYRDVNNCGMWGIFCDLISTAPGGGNVHPNHGGQCEICRIWQIQIQGLQRSEKWWFDCNGDGIADCEYWVVWAQLKGCSTGTTNSLSPDPFAVEEMECACEF
jgi:hypothetical protein